MGAWGTTLYSNDTTSAIRDEYIKKLNSGEPNEEITMDLIKEFQALICDTEEQALFWYALADMQLSHGMLMQYVRDKALLCHGGYKGIRALGASGSRHGHGLGQNT